MGGKAVAGGFHVPGEAQVANAKKLKGERSAGGSGLDWNNCRKVHKALILMGMESEDG